MLLSGAPLTLSEIESVATGGESVSLDPAAATRVAAARRVIETIIAENRVVYGVNTGFGKLSDVRIAHADLGRLQTNLVRSHACGVGPALPVPEVRAMMLLRANVVAAGFSGARVSVLEHLLAMLNRRVHPVVPESGSVGASGDLAPLAHLALSMIGEGECLSGEGRIESATALAEAGLEPLKLEAKEGLALLNGTQAMGAVGGLALSRALRLLHIANVAGSMSLEALMGTPAAFDSRIHAARRQPGQIECALELLSLLEGSEIRESHRHGDPRVQDAYCLRCMPQVHGSALDALRYAQGVVERESGAATDNPLVFTETEEVISGGNFHGAPLAHAFDFCAIVLTDLMSISERRIDRLVNPDLNEGLPPFLTSDAGVSSGLMIAHVTAAALLNECKVLSHPSSIDSVPTSGGKEDHVSMGMTGALKLRRIVDHLERVLAIELIAAAEGLEYRKPLKPGIGVLRAYDKVRGVVPRITEDRPFSVDIERLSGNLGQLV